MPTKQQVNEVLEKFAEQHPQKDIDPEEIEKTGKPVTEALSVGAIGEKGKIYIAQGRNVLAYGMTPNQARHLALALRRVACQVEQETNRLKKPKK